MYLSHYAGSQEVLLSILDIGFVFFPNNRGVFNELVNSQSSEEEPQCRGMISLTDTLVEESAPHRDSFGEFGIAIEKDWAIEQGATKVLYVGKGSPVFHSFQSLFTGLKPSPSQTGHKGLDDFVNQLATQKKAFAKSLGSPLYADLLDLHEFMQTDKSIAESEWRIMRQHKAGWSEGMDLKDVKGYFLLMAKAEIIPSLKISPAHTKFLVCPQSKEEELREKLEGEWKNVEIVTTTT